MFRVQKVRLAFEPTCVRELTYKRNQDPRADKQHCH